MAENKYSRPCILHPGHLTGDLWHVAAGQILTKLDPNNYRNQPVAVIPVLYHPKRAENDSMKRARPLWTYYRNLGLPVVVCRVAYIHGSSIDGAIYKQLPSTLDYMFRYQLDANNFTIPKSWDEALALSPIVFDPIVYKPSSRNTYETYELEFKNATKTEAEKYMKLADENSQPYQFCEMFCSTAVVMQYLNEKSDFAALGLALSIGYPDKMQQDQPQEKLNELSLMLKTAELEKVERKLELWNGSSVLIFNYRKGEVNKQHDANVQIFSFVQDIALKHGIVTIPVLIGKEQMLEGEEDALKIEAKAGILDLFHGVVSEKRFQARFWSLLCQESKKGSIKLVGSIGGRSGSLDLQSFCGIRCITWEEPLYDPGFDVTENYLQSQVPQYLRLVDQFPLMSICYLNIKTKQVATVPGKKQKYNRYTEIVVDRLVNWLQMKPSELPEIAEKWDKYIEYTRQCMNYKTFNFHSKNLDDVLKLKNYKL